MNERPALVVRISLKYSNTRVQKEQSKVAVLYGLNIGPILYQESHKTYDNSKVRLICLLA